MRQNAAVGVSDDPVHEIKESHTAVVSGCHNHLHRRGASGLISYLKNKIVGHVLSYLFPFSRDVLMSKRPGWGFETYKRVCCKG